jgi:integrase
VRRLARLFRWTPTVRRQRLKAVRALNRPWAVARYLLRKARKTPAAALKRLSAVRWAGRMFGRPPGEEELWRLVAARIRSQTASKPTHKARPLPPTLLRRLIDEVRHAAPQAAATLALAWITSGRIDDICRLGPRNMSKVDDWLVFDFRITKANKIAAPREDHCSAVQTHLIPQWLLHEATYWKQPDAKLKRRLYNLLRKLPPAASPFTSAAATCRRNYSLHSIKMGATHALLQAAAQGDPSNLISLALKHKQATSTLAPTTVGYASSPLLVAQATGITKTTALLAEALFPPQRHPRGLFLADGSFLPTQRPPLSQDLPPKSTSHHKSSKRSGKPRTSTHTTQNAPRTPPTASAADRRAPESRPPKKQQPCPGT